MFSGKNSTYLNHLHQIIKNSCKKTKNYQKLFFIKNAKIFTFKNTQTTIRARNPHKSAKNTTHKIQQIAPSHKNSPFQPIKQKVKKHNQFSATWAYKYMTKRILRAEHGTECFSQKSKVRTQRKGTTINETQLKTNDTATYQHIPNQYCNHDDDKHKTNTTSAANNTKLMHIKVVVLYYV